MAPFTPPPPFLSLETALALEEAALASSSSLPSPFSGEAFVAWAVERGFAKDEGEGAKAGQALLEHRRAHHVTDDAEFEPSAHQTYVFIARETPEAKAAHAALGALIARSDVHQGTLALKSSSFFGLFTSWTTCYAVLDAPASDIPGKPAPPRLLRFFKRRSAASPETAAFAVQDCACTVKECIDCKQDWTCFTLRARKGGASGPATTLTLCADHSKRQEGWIAALMDAGVEFLREVEGHDLDNVKSLHELSARRLNSTEVVPLSAFKGKVCLVVNISSKCGLTPKNNPELLQLYNRYHDQGLELLLFPCNQFGGQEPGDEPTVQKFLDEEYGIRFPIFEKTNVNGAHAHPVFRFLKANLGGGVMGSSIKWNYTKFLVDKEGRPIKRFGPLENPLSFEGDIKALL